MHVIDTGNYRVDADDPGALADADARAAAGDPEAAAVASLIRRHRAAHPPKKPITPKAEG